MLLVSDDNWPGEVESALIKGCFWRVRHEVTIYARLHYIAILTDELTGSGGNGRKRRTTHTWEISTLTTNSGSKVLPEYFSLVMACSWIQARTDYICLVEELIRVTTVTLSDQVSLCSDLETCQPTVT